MYSVIHNPVTPYRDPSDEISPRAVEGRLSTQLSTARPRGTLRAPQRTAGLCSLMPTSSGLGFEASRSPGPPPLASALCFDSVLLLLLESSQIPNEHPHTDRENAAENYRYPERFGYCGYSVEYLEDKHRHDSQHKYRQERE